METKKMEVLNNLKFEQKNVSQMLNRILVFFFISIVAEISEMPVSTKQEKCGYKQS